MAILTGMVSCMAAASADSTRFALHYKAETMVNISSGDFAPYYMASNNAGVLTQPVTVMERAQLYRPIDTNERFSYSFGVDAVADWSKATDYERYEAGAFHHLAQRPAYVWLQQLWGEVKWRGVFLTVGMKENDRSIFDGPLSSGDITLSNNARPIPQGRIGFIDFQDIPFTNGWVQIQGEIAYGKFADSNWLKNHYNYYNSFITTGVWFHYKRCYFRTNPEARFSVTVGMQHASQFGGYTDYYRKGELVSHSGSKVKFGDFLKVFVQSSGNKSNGGSGDEVYYYGNHLGSWDLQLRYRFDFGSLTAYMQSPWEDGSGIGKLNGWDGVWGLKYESADTDGWVRSALVEYIDFTNQSGPMHWAPGDVPGTQVPGQASGADDYYNNFAYNGWANYGMSLGTPLLKSPVYNRDGYMHFTDNRVRGFHVGIEGILPGGVEYRLLGGYRTSWGTPFIPAQEKRHDTSMMLEGAYTFPKVPGLSIKGQIAFDAGSLYGNNFGIMASVSYSGKIAF